MEDEAEKQVVEEKYINHEESQVTETEKLMEVKGKEMDEKELKDKEGYE